MIIYAIKVEDEKVASVLNFIKFLCAPNSKTEVHLSIRGPYKAKMSSDKINELNEIIKGTKISVNEAGNFFLYEQNTVYLKCSSNIIKKVWDKKSYGYNPHLTLYDGDDSVFANELYSLLSDMRINISFRASSLILYETDKLNASTLLTIGINNDVINEIIKFDWRTINPVETTIKDKLKLIKECFDEINS